MSARHAATLANLVRRARDPRRSLGVRHAAFAILVARFEAMALAVALRASDGVEPARDACQEAFLDAWRLLPTLREPAAFGGWLGRLVRTRCARARRRRLAVDARVARLSAGGPSSAGDTLELVADRETQELVRRAVDELPVGEREAMVRFYFLGEPLRAIAHALDVTAAAAGKRLHSGRLRLRRTLPRGLAAALLAARRRTSFTRQVLAGVFDEFVGEYRFAARPSHPVSIRREGDALISQSGGQRSTIASLATDTLAAIEFDGEARFQRDRRGRVSRFVYYEFGRRLGVAVKIGRAARR